MQCNHTSGTLASFLLGGLIGAGAALLFAPQPGRELRGRISSKVREGAVRGRELSERAAQKSRQMIDEAHDGMLWQKERLSAAVDAGRETYREEKSQA